MKCDLSIVVPIYNVEEYLENTIKSLLAQADYDYEIVLVNDGSKDGSGDICQRYLEKYPEKIQLVNKENGGLPSARKAGVRAAKGEFVTFLDGDDWVDADYYYQMIRAVKEQQLDVACSSHSMAYPDKNLTEKNGVDSGVYTGEALSQIRNKMLYQRPYYTYGIYPSLCMKVIRKELLEKFIYKVPDSVTIAEDAACSFPILFSCNGFVMLNENTGYYYRQVQSSMMKKYDPKKLSRVILVMDYMETVFAPYREKYGHQIDRYYTQLIKELVKNELLGDAPYQEKVGKIRALTEKEYPMRALKDLSGISLFYRIFFGLIRSRKFAVLNLGYTLYKKLKH